MKTLIVIAFFLASCVVSESGAAKAGGLIRTSCARARYPDICLNTLSNYTTTVKTPLDLAQAAVAVSLNHASKFLHYVGTLKGQVQAEKKALSDCVELIATSVRQLGLSLAQIKTIDVGEPGFVYKLSTVKSYVSAALTDDDTCGAGFKDLNVRIRAEFKVNLDKVTKVTSNALYLISCVW